MLKPGNHTLLMEHVMTGASNRNTNGISGTIVFKTNAAFVLAGLPSPKGQFAGSLLLHLEFPAYAAGTGGTFQIATGVTTFIGAPRLDTVGGGTFTSWPGDGAKVKLADDVFVSLHFGNTYGIILSSGTRLSECVGSVHWDGIPGIIQTSFP